MSRYSFSISLLLFCSLSSIGFSQLKRQPADQVEKSSSSNNFSQLQRQPADMVEMHLLRAEIPKDVTINRPDGSQISVSRCGYVHQNNPEIDFNSDEMKNRRSALQREERFIPIAFHVIYTDDGTGFLQSEHVEAQISALNTAYNSLDLSFYLDTLTYTIDASWFENDAHEYAYKEALSQSPSTTLNIYTTKAGGDLGYAYLPTDLDNIPSFADGVVLFYETVLKIGDTSYPYNEGDTGVHEVGHYLGLDHTFQDGCTGSVNTNEEGDSVSDTPQQDDGSNIYVCDENLDTCPAADGLDPVRNYMNYVDDDCMDQFTLGQEERMHFMLDNFRENLGACSQYQSSNNCNNSAANCYWGGENCLAGSPGDPCEENYISNCNYDPATYYDPYLSITCCDNMWLGDDYADCADQAYGCDLSCYDNDGGDCPDVCGDGSCTDDETATSCPEDCSSGTVQCWGRNNTGQSSPPSGTFTDISEGGGNHTCGIDNNGSIQCWGSDNNGQSTPPSGTFTDVSAGYHTCGIDNSGYVQCWGKDTYGETSPPSGTFTDISAGGSHTCGIDNSGYVQCWGSVVNGMSSPPSGVFTDISAGPYHTCGIDNSGYVQCWGQDGSGQSTPPSGTFTDISVGNHHACGIDNSGYVQCWGSVVNGQSIPPSGVFTDISAGGSHTCGIDNSGTVKCWGQNTYGESSPPSGTFTDISAGTYHTCGIQSDYSGSGICDAGEVELWVDCNDIPNHSDGCMPSGCYSIANTTYLWLYSQNLTGEIPTAIGELINLTSINLHNNNLSGEIPWEMDKLTNLTDLSMSGNHLSGSIPGALGDLTNLTSLSLNGNELSGQIPSEIGNLTSLHSLYLNDNQLTGVIPSTIGNLTNLSDLWLNKNELSGNIPDSICNLTINWSYDANFRISDNNLCPSYPYCVATYEGAQDTSSCSGDASCSIFVTEPTCNSADCSWDSMMYTCTEPTDGGTTSSCSIFVTEPTCNSAGCSWDSMMYTCTEPTDGGTTSSCSIFVTEPTCNSAGCSWDSMMYTCTEPAAFSSCNSYSSAASCNMNSNCYWDGSYCYDFMSNYGCGMYSTESYCNEYYHFPEGYCSWDSSTNSCEGCTESAGCIHPDACNYDFEATCDDGSCEHHSGNSFISTQGDDDNCGSAQYPLFSIQKGIDISFDGDTLFVLPGTYDIGSSTDPTHYSYKSLVIKSMAGSGSTFLNGTIVASNGGASTLSGFTFNGVYKPVFVDTEAHLLIEDCIFKNSGEETIQCNDGGSLSLQRTLIDGGRFGINNNNGGCQIAVNSTTIVNVSETAISIRAGVNLSVTNSIIHNYVSNAIHFWNEPPVYLEIHYNDITGNFLSNSVNECDGGFDCNIINNIPDDPSFSDPSKGDYSLHPSSYCIDSGDPSSPLDPDGTRADMGAYYYDQQINGCTDPMACNTNDNALYDDGTCVYAAENHDCYGDCTASYDCAGQCGGSAMTDHCAVCCGGETGIACSFCDGSYTMGIACDSSYSGPAYDDSGSCRSNSGCMNVNACNYDAYYTTSDGSCQYPGPGCPDNCPTDQSEADTYDCNGNCNPAEYLTDNNGNGIWDPGEDYVDHNGNGSWDKGQWQCADGGCIPPEYYCDGSSEYGNAGWGPDCADGSDEIFGECCANGSYDGSVCSGGVSTTTGCTDHEACNFNPESNATIDDGSCQYAEDYGKDINGAYCCPQELDACGECEGDNDCFEFPYNFFGSWDVISNTYYIDHECMNELDCNQYNESSCSDVHLNNCEWNYDNNQCQSRANALPEYIDLYTTDGRGIYDMKYIVPFEGGCSDNLDCKAISNLHDIECEISSGDCVAHYFDNYWGIRYNSEFCIEVPYDVGATLWLCGPFFENGNEMTVHLDTYGDCQKLVLQRSMYGCMDSAACNYNSNATQDNGSCQYMQSDSNGDQCCSFEMDACGECYGQNKCLYFPSNLQSLWQFSNQTFYTDLFCSVELNCSQYDNDDDCFNDNCHWNYENGQCEYKTNNLPSSIELFQGGGYEMLLSSPAVYANSDVECWEEIGFQGATYNPYSNECQYLDNGPWGVNDNNNFCIGINQGDVESNFTYLGEGECRDADGSYPLEFAITYGDLDPHWAGNNAELATQRCQAKCEEHSDWCFAVEVILPPGCSSYSTEPLCSSAGCYWDSVMYTCSDDSSGGTGWSSPECHLVTDWDTFHNSGNSLQNNEWGGWQNIDGYNYQTYCNGDGMDCSNTIWDGGSLSERDDYHCYVYNPSGDTGPQWICMDSYEVVNDQLAFTEFDYNNSDCTQTIFEKQSYGCLEDWACNFDPSATVGCDDCCMSTDCNGECGGAAQIDICGNCSGGGSGNELSWCDGSFNFSSGYCNGTPIGPSFDGNGYCIVETETTVSTISINDALDVPLDVIFITEADTGWFGQEEVWYYDGAAVQSGAIGHSQSSSLSTTIEGPGILSFWWKVSSEKNYDYLKIYLNGVEADAISGQQDWIFVSDLPLEEGFNEIKWEYTKDVMVSHGEDAGWIDHAEVDLGTCNYVYDPIGNFCCEDEMDLCDICYGNDDCLEYNDDAVGKWVLDRFTIYDCDEGDPEQGFTQLDCYKDAFKLELLSNGSANIIKPSSFTEAGDFFVGQALCDQPSETLETVWGLTYHDVFEHDDDEDVEDEDVEDTTSCLYDCPGISSVLSAESDDVFCTWFAGLGGSGAECLSDCPTWYLSELDDNYSNDCEDGEHKEFEEDEDGELEILCVDGITCGEYLKVGEHQLFWLLDGHSESNGPCTAALFELDSGGTLEGALDNLKLDFVTGGEAPWYWVDESIHDGDAARSGAIGSNTSSWIYASVNGPATLSFDWKINSSESTSILYLYYDNSLEAQTSGDVDWHEQTLTVGDGYHMVWWMYVTGDISSDQDAAWVDNVQLTLPLEESLNNPVNRDNDVLSFTNGSSLYIGGIDPFTSLPGGEGHLPWFGQNFEYYFDGKAAQSGGIGNSMESGIETEITGPATLKFSWKAATEEYYDWLYFLIDNDFYNVFPNYNISDPWGSLEDEMELAPEYANRRISGQTDWIEVEVEIESGSHIIRWGYLKDEFSSDYEDTGWLDNIEVEYPGIGCMNSSACNYDASATVDDGSCLILDCNDECGGSAIEDTCGICLGDNSTCTGCTDQIAINYDTNAIIHDDSCTYPVYGCTDIEATNYNSSATNSDGTCQYPGLLGLSFGEINTSDSTVAIWFNSTADISTLLFTMSGAAINNVSGGAAETAGFNLSIINRVSIFGSGNLPADNGMLTEIKYEADQNEFCIFIIDVQPSDENQVINTESGACLKVIGPAGGIIEGQQEQVDAVLNVPMNALQYDHAIEVGEVAEDLAESIDNGTGHRINNMVSMTPYGTQFAVPISITISEQSLSRTTSATETLMCYLQNESDGEWEVLADAVCSGSECTADNISRLGIYAICILTEDCNGDLGGDAYEDDCGQCVGGNTVCSTDQNPSGNAGACELNWSIDVCGLCGGSGFSNWYQDLDGDGSGYGSPVQFCANNVSAGYVANASDTEPGCATNDTDTCGVCGGDNSSCSGCTDKTNYYADIDGDGKGAGTVYEFCSNPGTGWSATNDDSEPNCATNDTDACGVCGGAGATLWYMDDDSDGLGNPSVIFQSCTNPGSLFVPNNSDSEPDCSTNDTDQCGMCGGGDQNIDCANVCNISTAEAGLDLDDNTRGNAAGAAIDDCGICSGGDTGRIANADRDDCDVCFGYNTCLSPIFSTSTLASQSPISLHQETLQFTFSNKANNTTSLALSSESNDALSITSRTGSPLSYNTIISGTILEVALDTLTSNDTLDISIDASKLSAEGGYLLDSDETDIPGFPGDNITMELYTGMLGDFDADRDVDEVDAGTLLSKWKSGNSDQYSYELGPFSGTAPNLVVGTAFDSKWDIEDLMAFIEMYEWSSEHSGGSLQAVNDYGLKPQFKLSNSTLSMTLPNYNEEIYYIWYNVIVSSPDLIFTLNEVVNEYDMALSRSSLDNASNQSLFMNFENSIWEEKINLGSFSTEDDIEKAITVQYKIRSINTLLSSGSMIMDYTSTPEKYELSQAYPNPFNPSTTIEYGLPMDSELVLSVYDIQGRLVTTLHRGLMSAGYYHATWNASKHSSGIYFIQLEAFDLDGNSSFESMQKIMLVK